MSVSSNKLSNYIGQAKDNKKLDNHLVSVDKDIQNLWKGINLLVNVLGVDTDIGNLTMFKDQIVGDTTDGKKLILHRKAAEGNVRLEMYVHNNRNITFDKIGGGNDRMAFTMNSDDVDPDATWHFTDDVDGLNEMRIDNTVANTDKNHLALTLYDGGTEQFSIKHNNFTDATTIYNVGTLTFTDNVVFGSASTDTYNFTGRMIVRQVTDAGPMTATGGTQGEIVFNTSNSTFYGCTVTHATAATWVAFH